MAKALRRTPEARVAQRMGTLGSEHAQRAWARACTHLSLRLTARSRDSGSYVHAILTMHRRAVAAGRPRTRPAARPTTVAFHGLHLSGLATPPCSGAWEVDLEVAVRVDSDDDPHHAMLDAAPAICWRRDALLNSNARAHAELAAVVALCLRRPPPGERVVGRVGRGTIEKQEPVGRHHVPRVAFVIGGLHIIVDAHAAVG